MSAGAWVAIGALYLWAIVVHVRTGRVARGHARLRALTDTILAMAAEAGRDRVRLGEEDGRLWDAVRESREHHGAVADGLGALSVKVAAVETELGADLLAMEGGLEATKTLLMELESRSLAIGVVSDDTVERLDRMEDRVAHLDNVARAAHG